MSTQIHLFKVPLSLISIPLDLYPRYAHGVLKLLLRTWREEIWVRELSHSPPLNLDSFALRRSFRAEDNTNSKSATPIEGNSPAQIEEKCDALEEFVNVTFTPLECSVICPTELLNVLWSPELLKTDRIDLLKEQYVAIQIDGDGLDTGMRVLQISSPMSTAGIPIFFLTTYFSEYMLVPKSAEKTVEERLQTDGFTFSTTSKSYVLTEPASNHFEIYPQDLVEETFTKFADAEITPTFNKKAKLLLTGSRNNDDSLHLALVKALLSPPRYFSITMNGPAEISFLIDSTSAQAFPEHALLGSPTEYLVPVSIDLTKLPQDATGIVAAVASKVVANQKSRQDPSAVINMSYISTVNSGLVLVYEEDAHEVVNALNNRL